MPRQVNPCLSTFRLNLRSIHSQCPATPSLPILPILPQPYFLCVLGDLCGVRAIMQNKPNFQKAKTTANSYIARSYSNIPPRPTRKNKPNQTQFPSAVRNTQCHIRHTRELETKGIEPSFPRCDRGVLPLHHVPEHCSVFCYCTRWPRKVKPFQLPPRSKH